MKSYKDQMFLPYPAEDLYKIILDVEKYPLFLPWCKEIKIIKSDENFIEAEVTANFKAIKSWYTCTITFSPPTKDKIGFVKVRELDGSFKYLNNTWKLEKKDKGTLVEFFIEFEFKSKILDKVLGFFYKTIQKKILNAFYERIKIECTK